MATVDPSHIIEHAEVEFWDSVYANSKRFTKDEILSDLVLCNSLDFFGAVAGKNILDFGCGDGKASLFFALHGAKVVAVDTSSAAIRFLHDEARRLELSSIDARAIPVQNLVGEKEFDFIFGQFILHHLEPFEEIPALMNALLAQNGKAYFRENSANNRVLMFFRNHVIGKFGIPKLGDASEEPLSADKIELLRTYFKVETEYPEMILWHLVSIYVLKRRLIGLTHNLDDFTYRFLPFLRKYSYYQRLKISKS
jgi:2-polyprenyl-3-methyl-5-hydroxy-6-metoxy-1,4-benzoquinol methylase